MAGEGTGDNGHVIVGDIVKKYNNYLSGNFYGNI
jgi:hypothetical protein